MSSGSEKNLIFALQGEEERWKNRIRYAETSKKTTPPSSQHLQNLPSFWGQDIRKAPMASRGPGIKFGPTLVMIKSEKKIGIKIKNSELSVFHSYFIFLL